MIIPIPGTQYPNWGIKYGSNNSSRKVKIAFTTKIVITMGTTTKIPDKK